MKVKGFFLDRYMIAVYENDLLICLADNIRELCSRMRISKKQAYYRICCGKYNLIDITEIHNDCFKEEDKIFLKEIIKF